MITLTPDSLKYDSPIPTLGRIPFALIRIGRRLHRKNLVGNPKFAVHKPKPAVIESES